MKARFNDDIFNSLQYFKNKTLVKKHYAAFALLKFFFCIHDIYKAPVAFFWYSLMPLMILELPKNIHWKLQIFPHTAIF